MFGRMSKTTDFVIKYLFCKKYIFIELLEYKVIIMICSY